MSFYKRKHDWLEDCDFPHRFTRVRDGARARERERGPDESAQQIERARSANITSWGAPTNKRTRNRSWQL